MTARVIQLHPRPREFYAVSPGDEDGPVAYEKTKRGAESALAHAMLLSAGGGYQYVTLTEGRETRVLCTIRGGLASWTRGEPQPYRTEWVPLPGQVRKGSPGGHIPELCTYEKNRAAGKTPRRPKHMPKSPSYKQVLALMQASLEQE